MAIEDIGICYDSASTRGVQGYRIKEADDPYVTGGHKLRLCWSTEYGTTTDGSNAQTGFVIALRWKTYPKGISYETDWVSKTVELTAAQCNEYLPRHGGRVYWSVPFDTLGLTSAINGGKTWLYSNRENDNIYIEVSICATWPSGLTWTTATKSPTSSTWLAVGYIPIYRLSGIYYVDSDTVGVDYTTTWTRRDDRCNLEWDSMIGSEHLLKDSYQIGYQGALNGSGHIEFPAHIFRHNLVGRNVKLHIRFNAAYRPVGMDFSDIDESTTVAAKGDANTPTLAYVGIPDTPGDPVGFQTGDSDDKGFPLSKVTVSLSGGKFELDSVTVDAGEVAYLPYVPLGIPFTVEAIGTTASGGTGDKTTIDVPAIDPDGAVWLQAIDRDYYTIKLKWHKVGDDIGPDISVEPAVEIVKLAGRRRESAYYGYGGTATLRYSAYLLYSTIEESGRVLATPEQGDLMMRFPDGDRFAISANVTVSKEERRIKQVTIDGKLVSR